jgi:DNA-binding transcriptional LysR family regulator
MARLEGEAGMALFERAAKGLALTRTGAGMLAHARGVLQSMQALRSALDEQRASHAGQVRLGSIPYLMPSLVSPLLARFFVQRPLATFSIETHLSARLMDMLRQGGIDLALVAVPAQLPQGVACSPLGPMRMQIVAREGHPRLDRLRGWPDLAGERWAMPAASLYLRQWLDEKFGQAGLAPPRVAVESTASPVAFAQLLRQSDLLGLMLSRSLLQPEGQGLAALSGEGMAWSHGLAVCWRGCGVLSPLCLDFRDAVTQWCSEHGV